MAQKPARSFVMFYGLESGRGDTYFETDTGGIVYIPSLRWSERGYIPQVLGGDIPSSSSSFNEAKKDLGMRYLSVGVVPLETSAPSPKADAKVPDKGNDTVPDTVPSPSVRSEPNHATTDGSDVVADALDSALGLSRIVETRIGAFVSELTDRIDTLEARNPIVNQVVYKDREPVTIDGTVHPMFERVGNLLADGFYPMLVGPAGTGKSTIVRKVAESLGVDFSLTTCSDDMDISKFEGFRDAMGAYQPTGLRERFGSGGVHLAEEWDFAPGAVAGGLNTLLSMEVAQFPDGMVDRHDDFRFAATANTGGRGATDEYTRNVLDASTLDRFVFVFCDYDATLEESIASAYGADGVKHLEVMRKVRQNADKYGISALVSTRQIERVKMLGYMSHRELCESTFLFNQSDDARTKLLAGTGV